MKGANESIKMGNCFPFVRRKKKGNREITLAILGLDNAGKTTTTRSLQGESLETVVPTMGFENIEFSIDNFNITMFDLGGGRTIRSIWQNYFSEIHGLVYVVDSSEPRRLNECKDVLTKLISDPKISGKPVLLLANKQDLDTALDEGEIIEELDIEHVVNYYKCPCRVERCSAIIGVGKQMDKSIRTGFQWLLGYIDQNMTELDSRVRADVKIREEQLAKEKIERRERVRRVKEEREREAKARGEVDDDENEDVAVDPQFDPFKPLAVDNFDKKNADNRKETRISKPMLDNGDTKVEQNPSQPANKSTEVHNSQPTLDKKMTDLKLSTIAQTQQTNYSDITSSGGNTSLFITSEAGSGDNLQSASHRSHLSTPHTEHSNINSHLPPLTLESDSARKHKKKKSKKHKSKKNRLTPAEENIDPENSPVKRYSNPNIFVTEKLVSLDDLDDTEEAMPPLTSHSKNGRLLPNADREDIVT